MVSKNTKWQEQEKLRNGIQGIYCFQVKNLFNALKQTSNHNQQSEYYLTDTIEILYKQGKTISNVVLEDLMEVQE